MGRESGKREWEEKERIKRWWEETVGRERERKREKERVGKDSEEKILETAKRGRRNGQIECDTYTQHTHTTGWV